MKQTFPFLLFTFLLVSCSQPLEDNGNEQIQSEQSDPASSAVSSDESIETISYSLQPVFENLTFEDPLAFVFDSEQIPYVVERTGRIYAIQNEEKELFLDLSDVVQSNGQEQGLLGFVFEPDSDRFYVNYTANGQTHISRFTTADELPITSETEERILSFDQPYSNHNGGHLAFGPDGYLYIATGDGGSSGDPMHHAQNTNSLLGKILRIDVSTETSYLIPEDNFKNEIYAYGLRNPWRFSFDKETGDLWVADVGQDAMEEINVIESGHNYGWNIFEGNLDHNKHMMMDGGNYSGPIWEYNHSMGQSITGGFVYRGETFPELQGHYIYGDFVSGTIWALEFEDQQAIKNSEILQTDLAIASFGEDDRGEIYVVDFSGMIYQLER